MRFGFFMVAALMLAAVVARAETLSDEMVKNIQAAKQTNNAFVLEATLNAVRAAHPQSEEAIQAVLAAPVVSDVVTAQTPAEEAPSTWYGKLLSGWNGTVEAGLNFVTGNTKSRTTNAALNMETKQGKWHHEVGVKASGKHEDNARTEEKYRARGETGYDIGEKTYVFGEAEYVNDQFSGYEYRFTEAVGLGHRIYERSNMWLDLKGSVGGRHSKVEDTGEKENEVILKPAAEFQWDINENLSFNQKASSTVGSDRTISELNSALSSKIIGDLSLKLGVDVEHTSDVPEGTKQTDTTTSLNLVYGF